MLASLALLVPDPTIPIAKIALCATWNKGICHFLAGQKVTENACCFLNVHQIITWMKSFACLARAQERLGENDSLGWHVKDPRGNTVSEFLHLKVH